MKNLFERIKRNKKKSLFLALIMFLALALPVTGYFVTSEYGFDDRSQASMGDLKYFEQHGRLPGTPVSNMAPSTPVNQGAMTTVQSAGNGISIVDSVKFVMDSFKSDSKKDPKPSGNPTSTANPSLSGTGPSTSNTNWYAQNSGDPKDTRGYSSGSGATTGSLTSSPSSTSGGPTTSSPTSSSSGNWFTNFFSSSSGSKSSGGGGTTTTTPTTSPTDPKCGTHHEQLFAAMQRVWPAGSFCAKGTADPANPVFPAEGNIVTWNCIEGSKSVSCTSGRDFLTKCATTADCSQEAPYEICFNDVCLRGDVLNNGVISMSDFAEFRKDFASFKRNGWTDALMRSDFNMDGRISMADFSIFVSSYRLVNGLD